MENSFDYLIIGSGVVGLSIAWQLLEKDQSISIAIVEKEKSFGQHTSGKNSGILHAGIYYEPGSLKAKVCVKGAKRLKEWCNEQKIPILNCGKVITPQKPELDKQLDILLERGRQNGAKVELIDTKQFNQLVPDGRTSTGRALWSPNTCVVKPLSVLKRMHDLLIKRGVKFFMESKNWKLGESKTEIIISNGDRLKYGHLYNCAGLQADKIAHLFGVGKQYTMLPFKGNYYRLKKNIGFNFKTNLYPVPDLEVPFLGVHITPTPTGEVFLGPTATPAFGRENYFGFENFEAITSLQFLKHMSKQFFLDKRMRKYIINQSFEWLPSRFIASARSIVPKIELSHLELSNKVGIRPQLYDIIQKKLIQDFIKLEGKNSTHVINAISPAFTASFELADFILEN